MQMFYSAIQINKSFFLSSLLLCNCRGAKYNSIIHVNHFHLLSLVVPVKITILFALHESDWLVNNRCRYPTEERLEAVRHHLPLVCDRAQSLHAFQVLLRAHPSHRIDCSFVGGNTRWAPSNTELWAIFPGTRGQRESGIMCLSRCILLLDIHFSQLVRYWFSLLSCPPIANTESETGGI